MFTRVVGSLARQIFADATGGSKPNCLPRAQTKFASDKCVEAALLLVSDDGSGRQVRQAMNSSAHTAWTPR